MALHRLTALALTGALALGVSACGEDSPSPAPRTSSAASSPTPTAPAAPVLSDLATRHDDVGAKAFVKFYFAALTYAMKTGDTEPVSSISTDDCNTCSKLIGTIEATYAEKGSLSGNGWTVLALRTVDDRPDGAHVYGFVRQSSQMQRDSTGSVVAHTPDKKFGIEVLAVWESGWRIREVALL